MTRESVTRHVTRDSLQQLGAPRDTVFRAVMGGGDIGYGRIFVEVIRLYASNTGHIYILHVTNVTKV